MHIYSCFLFLGSYHLLTTHTRRQPFPRALLRHFPACRPRIRLFLFLRRDTTSPAYARRRSRSHRGAIRASPRRARGAPRKEDRAHAAAALHPHHARGHPRRARADGPAARARGAAVGGYVRADGHSPASWEEGRGWADAACVRGGRGARRSEGPPTPFAGAAQSGD